MRTAATAGLVMMCLMLAHPVRGADKSGFARGIAEKLMAAKGPRPQTHTTDFRGDSLGCITLTSRELSRFGYAGHAFFCEDDSTAEILGAVLGRFGRVSCYISGDYVGNGCYDFTICDIPDSACVN